MYRLLTILMAATLGACATSDYRTYYGLFEAQNTEGKVRQFRVHWQTLKKANWSEESTRATPIILETQCSRRVLRFFDEAHGNGLKCKPNALSGVVYCLNSERDTRALPIGQSDESVCADISDGQGRRLITEFEDEIYLWMHCIPKETSRKTASETINLDYLNPSSSPYKIAIGSYEGKAGDGRLPELKNQSAFCEGQ